MSSGNAIGQNIVSHNHTFRHTGLYKYRIVLTFMKPTCRGGEGQNGWLKCPLGFLVSFYFNIMLTWLQRCRDPAGISSQVRYQIPFI